MQWLKREDYAIENKMNRNRKGCRYVVCKIMEDVDVSRVTQWCKGESNCRLVSQT